MSEAFKLTELTDKSCLEMGTSIGHFVLQKMWIDPLMDRKEAPNNKESHALLNGQMHIIENLLANTISNLLINEPPEYHAQTIGNVMGVMQQSVGYKITKISKGLKGKKQEGMETLATKEFEKPEVKK